MLILLSVALAGDNDFVATDYSTADKQIHYEGHIDAPPDAVYAALLDHEGMTAWMPKISAVTVDNTNAQTENGVGCERTCSFGNMPIQETVVWVDEGVGYAYTVNEGPVDNHVGVVRIQDDGQGGTNVVWEQYFEVNSMKSRMMRKKMPKLLDEAVGNLELQLQSESTTNS